MCLPQEVKGHGRSHSKQDQLEHTGSGQSHGHLDPQVKRPERGMQNSDKAKTGGGTEENVALL